MTSEMPYFLSDIERSCDYILFHSAPEPKRKLIAGYVATILHPIPLFKDCSQEEIIFLGGP